MRAGLQSLQLGSGVLDTKYGGVGGTDLGGWGQGEVVSSLLGTPPNLKVVPLGEALLPPSPGGEGGRVDLRSQWEQGLGVGRGGGRRRTLVEPLQRT